MEDIFKSFKPKSVTYTPRSDAGSMSILGSVQMSEGRTTFKNMHIVSAKSNIGVFGFYILQCGDEFPKESLWKGKGMSSSGEFKCEEIDGDLAWTIEEAVSVYNKEEFKSHINPYSFIYGYVMKGVGVRLHDMWSFEVDREF